MRLVDAYSVEDADVLLYKLLAERPRESWISHERLPMFGEHRAFVASHPFRYWLLIAVQAAYIGAIEVTDRNEIGIAVLRQHQRHGYGRWALRYFFREYQPLPAIHAVRNGCWLVNVAVGNEGSREFFRKMGFSTIQETMVLQNG